MAVVTLIDTTLLHIDPIVDDLSATKLKLAIGSKTVATGDLAWQGVATHEQGDAVAASDGLVVMGIVDASGNAQPVKAGTDKTASATGAASILTATLAAVASVTTYITGFEVTGLGATTALGITVAVTGTLGGTLSYILAVPAGVLVGATPLIVEFSRPIPASAVNTAIVVTVPSFGAGNTLAAVVAHGFVQ
jgi:hypothetical protein